MADINIQEVTNHINIETANGYKLEFNGPVVNMNVVLSNYYTKTETDALLNDKADKADTYTKSETNILLNDKADKADTYTISQINDMVQDIYTAVDTKQNIITGAASTITNSNLTANRAVISNASGKVAVSNVTSTELGYLLGVTSGVQTQLNNKASTSLDNLSAAGQMIIDSQNGTISNCILEIPQNIKLTLENNVLTLKAGSILTLTGSTYETATTTQDKTISYSNFTEGVNYMIFASRAGALQGLLPVSLVFSGTTFPNNVGTNSVFFNTDEKAIYIYQNSQWNAWGVVYPICILHASNGTLSFAKDSNGNDMIFNGAGFIGHHAFVYPNVKVLIPNGIDTNGKMKSTSYTSNSLVIEELVNYNSPTSCITIPAGDRWAGYKEVDTYEDFLNQYPTSISNTRFYVKNLNQIFLYTGSAIITQGRIAGADYQMSGTTVTDFTLRQPYQGARNLLTDDLYKQIGDVETLLASI